jgi:hypothetical protein
MIHFFENQSNAILQYKREAKFRLKIFPTELAFADSHKMKIRVNGFFVSRAAMVTPGVPMPLKSPKTWQFQESSELRSFIIATADEDFDPMLSQNTLS